MKIFLMKQIIPLAAFGAAVAGAFSTVTTEGKGMLPTPVASFTKLNPAGACGSTEYTCDLDNIGPVCRIGGTGAQLWGKDANGNCLVEVHMEPR